MVGLAARWENGVLVGIGFGKEAGPGLDVPSAYQLWAGARILEGQTDGVVSSVVPGQTLVIAWPDDRNINGASVELGQAVTAIERMVIADLLRFIAETQMHGDMVAQAMKPQQIVRPSIAVPGGMQLQ